MDHFARLGLPRAFFLDSETLNRAYERLSFRHHPDFLAGESPDARQRAEQEAAEINEGYRVLSSDLERGAYLLDLLVGEARTQGKVPVVWQLNKDALPRDFLQRMFLLQEEVDEVSGEAAERLRAQINAERLALIGVVGSHLDGLALAPDPESFQLVRSVLNQQRYLLRLLERLKERAA